MKFDEFTFGLAGIMAIIIFLVSLVFTIPIFNRYQARQEANNQVQLNEITIKQQDQLIAVEQKKAQIRVAEAQGIAQSQKIIDSSLTVNYLQYLAIQSQEKMAGSPNHTEVYIPVGTNGIPLVKTLPNE